MMYPAMVRIIRQGLGLTRQELADHLGVEERTVSRWENGDTPIRPARQQDLLALDSTAEAIVQHHVETFNAAPPGVPRVMLIAASDHAWPLGWQRAIAYRVYQQVPGLLIRDDGDESS